MEATSTRTSNEFGLELARLRHRKLADLDRLAVGGDDRGARRSWESSSGGSSHAIWMTPGSICLNRSAT